MACKLSIPLRLTQLQFYCIPSGEAFSLWSYRPTHCFAGYRFRFSFRLAHSGTFYALSPRMILIGVRELWRVETASDEVMWGVWKAGKCSLQVSLSKLTFKIKIIVNLISSDVWRCNINVNLSSLFFFFFFFLHNLGIIMRKMVTRGLLHVLFSCCDMPQARTTLWRELSLSENKDKLL